MMSFGGATSFPSSFTDVWLNPISKYYINGTTITSIQQSAQSLANDLVAILNANLIQALDIDVEHIPPYNPANYNDIVNYLGYMSQYVKQSTAALQITTVSHSPQTPYLYPAFSYWCPYYYSIDSAFGNYIDFYNVQYYNNGLYNDLQNIFINNNSITS